MAFTAPTAQTDVSATTRTVTWTAASDATSGVAQSLTTLQRTAISGVNTCGTSWTGVNNASTAATSTALSGLQHGYSYRLGVQAQDGEGNTGSIIYSAPTLVDATAPAAPAVTDNCASLGTCYRVANTIYFRPAAASTDSAALDVVGLVDSLVGRSHRSLIGEVDSQPMRDLFGTPRLGPAWRTRPRG